jgi:hypothetical protein
MSTSRTLSSLCDVSLCRPAIRTGTFIPFLAPPPKTPPPTFADLTDDDPSHLDPFLPTPEAVRKHPAKLKKQKKPYTMDLTVMAGKKKVYKSACIRDRCKRRFREAVRMVVVRGARKDENAPGAIAVSEEVVGETGPRKWLMAGAWRSHGPLVARFSYRHDSQDTATSSRLTLRCTGIRYRTSSSISGPR